MSYHIAIKASGQGYLQNVTLTDPIRRAGGQVKKKKRYVLYERSQRYRVGTATDNVDRVDL